MGRGGLRIRIALARLRPDAHPGRDDASEPAVRVLAAARSDVSDELDVRGQRAQDAREAVRAFVDEAALAGLAERPRHPRPRHGRGPRGRERRAAAHPLVERQESGLRGRERPSPTSSLAVPRFIGRDNVRKRLGPLEGTAGRRPTRTARPTIESEAESLVVRPPFGLAHEGSYDHVHVEPLLTEIAADHLVAAVLVRLGGYAVGVFEGERLVASKVGSRFVKSRHKKGGSSANRFRRRREEQARALADAAAEVAHARSRRSASGSSSSPSAGTAPPSTPSSQSRPELRLAARTRARALLHRPRAAPARPRAAALRPLRGRNSAAITVDEREHACPRIRRGVGVLLVAAVEEAVRRALVGDDLVLDTCGSERFVERGIRLRGDVLVVTRLEREDRALELARASRRPGNPFRSPGFP